MNAGRATSRRAFLSLALGLCACATARMYDGEARPAHEVAIIRSASKLSVLFNPNPAYVRSIDGRPVRPTVSTLVVAPGRHVLVTRCRANLIYGSTHEIAIDADPGVEYQLKSMANPTTRCAVHVVTE